LRFTGDPTEAQDVTQAVFIILAQKAVSLRHRTTLTGWLYETTRLTASQSLRTKARRQAREQEAYMQSTLNDSTDSAWKQLAPLLEEAMARLNEKERTLLALRFFENKTGAETAALLGIEEWATHKRVSRAVDKLRLFFTKRGVVVPAAVLTAAISANSVQAAPAVLAKTATVAAITKGATASTSTLTLIKGALKVMAWTKAKTAVATGVILLLVGGSTTMVVVEAKSGKGPLGPFMEKKRQKDALVEQVGSMRSVFAAIIEYAHAHQDELPKSFAELNAFLPASIIGMDDDHWEMPVRGKITTLMKRQDLNSLVLIQQKNVPPDKAKIIMYMDGSVTYKK
jgi:RNA polymerase sigma factor (sigma-70 family)